MAAQENSDYSASVIVCTYRREQVLCETLRQLMEQMTPDYEVIVVDQTEVHDEETARYLGQITGRDSVQYERLSPPGLPAARNRGAELARSDVLIYCDDDVILCEDYVAKYLACFREHPDVSAVAGQVLNRGERAQHAPGMFFHDGALEDFHLLYGANFGVRKAAFQQVGGLPESLGVHAYTEDRILALELRSRGLKIRYDPAVSVQHLADPQGGCRITDTAQQTKESAKSFSKLYYLFRYSRVLDRSERFSTWKDALRQGPLRRHIVLRPWLWPKAWWGFVAAMIRARRLSAAAPHQLSELKDSIHRI